MDTVFDAVKKVSMAAKEFIDGTAAQSKNLLLRNAFSTGRLSPEDIRKSLKLGIPFFLFESEARPLKTVILRTEFTETEKRHFQPGDSVIAHVDIPPFDMVCSAMSGFRRIMMEYNLTPSMIANSICRGELRDFANPAKSGSLFFLTADDEYILKTVRDYEAHFFQSDLLNDYYHNLAKRKRSFLARYYGMYSYTQQYSFLTLRFVIMSNIIPSSLPINECYDLKGSKRGRVASQDERLKQRPTYKDIDFLQEHPEGFFLPPSMYDRLAEVIRDDVAILQGWNVIDYSLLVGVHNISNPSHRPTFGAGVVGALGKAVACTPLFPFPGRPSPGWNLVTNQAESSAQMQGWNCPVLRMFYDDFQSARMFNDPAAFVYGGIPAVNARGERLAIFLGIIDILQTYDVSKQVQNYMQGLQSPCEDESDRSIIEPRQYAERFLNFILGQVFHRGSTDLGTARVTSILPKINSNFVMKGQSFAAAPYGPPPRQQSFYRASEVSAPPYPGEALPPYGLPAATLPYPVEDKSYSSVNADTPPYPVAEERYGSVSLRSKSKCPFGFVSETGSNTESSKRAPYPVDNEDRVERESQYDNNRPPAYSFSDHRRSLPDEKQTPYPTEATPRCTSISPESSAPYPVSRPATHPDPVDCIRKSTLYTPSMPPLPERCISGNPVVGMPPLPESYQFFPDEEGKKATPPPPLGGPRHEHQHRF